jgi:hypothetical protein
MAKNPPITIHRDDDMKAIDDELDEAVEQLSDINSKVDDLLDSYDGDAPLPIHQEDLPADAEKADTQSDTLQAEDAESSSDDDDAFESEDEEEDESLDDEDEDEEEFYEEDKD